MAKRAKPERKVLLTPSLHLKFFEITRYSYKILNANLTQL